MPAHFPVPSGREASPEERAETRRRSLALLSHSLRPHRVALIVSILSVFVVTIASAVQPLLIARVLDSAADGSRGALRGDGCGGRSLQLA